MRLIFIDFRGHSKNRIPTSSSKNETVIARILQPSGLDKRSNERHSDGVIRNHPVTYTVPNSIVKSSTSHVATLGKL